MRKIKHFVKYPAELDLSAMVGGSKYELYAVLIHEGFSLNSGHYYSYVKGFDNRWNCMDDSSVSPTAESNALRQCPYLLFYKKKIDLFHIDKKEIAPLLALPIAEVKLEQNSKPHNLIEQKSSIKSEKLESDIKESEEANKTHSNTSKTILNFEKAIDNNADNYEEAFYYSICNNFISLKMKKILSAQSHMKSANRKEAVLNGVNHKILDKKIQPKSKNLKFKKIITKSIPNETYRNLTGKSDISLWEDDAGSLIEDQAHFLNASKSFVKPKLNYKDKYDIEYDTGKQKKIKVKKDFEETKLRDNSFQRVEKKFYGKRTNNHHN